MTEFLYKINWNLIIASIAIFISVITIIFQKKHNKLSFKPIPVLVKYNYISTLRVRIWNKGTGPLIIKSIIVEKNGIKKNNLIDFMPKIPKGIHYVEYIKDFENRVISPGESLRMIEFKKKEEKYAEWFKKIKETLHGVSVTMKYENIYGDKEVVTFKKLVFGITIDEEKTTQNNV